MKAISSSRAVAPDVNHREPVTKGFTPLRPGLLATSIYRSGPRSGLGLTATRRVSEDAMTQEDKGAPPAPDPIVEKAQRDKAIADARTAEAAARKAELEADDLESVSGQQAREAKNKQALAEAEQKAALARQQVVAALVPDLSKVKDSTLTVGKDGPAIASGIYILRDATTPSQSGGLVGSVSV